MSNQFKFYTKLTLSLMVLFTVLLGQGKDPKRELKRLNAKIDRVRVMVDSLELDNQILHQISTLINSIIYCFIGSKQGSQKRVEASKC